MARLEDKRRRIRAGLRTKRKKRKAAFALSASVMGLNTAALDSATSMQQAGVIAQMQDAGAIPDANGRVEARFLETSDEMKEALIEEEGVRLTVYRDVAGYPTVGVGHLVKPGDKLRVGDRISEERALDFLDRDLQIAERGVQRLVGDLRLTQHEFDALVDLVFNVGEGNVSEARSPRLNEAIASGDYTAIAAELEYHHAGGAKAKGLVYRSERRTNIFLEATYEDPRELRA
ncbi:lysozyme [Erythrobacter sp. HKB08]|uniref:lysozyme n=1 Tax=Erythrobacter sp. HKB08 TaxID=2502843 RepID=UPI001F18A828|nr:lysozyme [Erythrobacter sp. HKB08]